MNLPKACLALAHGACAENGSCYGDVSNIRGDVSGIYGNVSNIRGNLDECELTDEDRARGIDISQLIG